MGSTNKTAHYELPQFVANDKPSWLGDVNQAMEAIDTGIFGAKSSADGAQTTANNAVAGVQTANTRMDGMQTQLDTVATQANQTATAVNQHTSAIATNSANINTINSRLGNTDISDIGDGTVSGAIAAISGGGGGGASNVRWNATTDRFEVLKNGSWVQSIRAFVNSLAVFVAGIFGISVSNGVYKAINDGIPAPWTNANSKLTCSQPTGYNEYTLISDDLIDLSNYSTLKIKFDNQSNVTIDVSGSSASGYFYTYRNNVRVGYGFSTSKTEFATNAISGLSDSFTLAAGDIGITEITIE